MSHACSRSSRNSGRATLYSKKRAIDTLDVRQAFQKRRHCPEDRSERILEIRCDGAEANKLLLFTSKVYPEAVQYRKGYHGCAEVGLATHCCYR